MSEAASPPKTRTSLVPEDREKVRKSWRAWGLYLAFLVLFTWVYIFLGAGVILRPSTEAVENLQKPYIEAVYRNAAAVEKSKEEAGAVSAGVKGLFPYQTNGVVEPLFPWLARGLSDFPPDELLEKGRWANLFLCCGLLVLMGVGAARAFSFTGAAAMLMMGGFGIILERSAYFTPDALYNLLVLVAWMCSLSLIRQNHLWLYAVLGVLLGFIYLVRPPIWPLLLAFILVSILRTFGEWYRRRREVEESKLWLNSNQLVGFAMLVTAFILITGPRLSYASTTFGYPFHSFSSLALWMDSSAEVMRATQEMRDRSPEATVAWTERPGLVSFTKENGVSGLWSRAMEGAQEQIRNSVIGRQGGILLYGLFVFLVIAIMHRWAVWRQNKEIWKVRGTSARWMLAFLVVGVFLNLLFVGLGNQVTPNSAATTAMFLPMLMTFVWIAERYRRQLQRTHLADVVNLVYCGLMVLPILWISFRIFSAVRVALLA